MGREKRSHSPPSTKFFGILHQFSMAQHTALENFLIKRFSFTHRRESDGRWKGITPRPCLTFKHSWPGIKSTWKRAGETFRRRPLNLRWGFPPARFDRVQFVISEGVNRWFFASCGSGCENWTHLAHVLLLLWEALKQF